MKVYRTINGIVLAAEGKFKALGQRGWDQYINRDGLYEAAMADFTAPGTNYKGAFWFDEQVILPPLHRQEVWAAGVTYLRSRDARMDESKQAAGEPRGASAFYDKVYDADRPELFFKATAQRTVGTNDYVNTRADSTWDVPEPELTLFVTSTKKIVGYTIGNDMSSRSIEGENPLYLPQAKTYDRCASLGPCLYVPERPMPAETLISLSIARQKQLVFEKQIKHSQMKRSHTELVDYLFRECTFPDGVYLMTGTGIVPPDGFTLQSGDAISITIDGIGTLQNWVN